MPSLLVAFGLPVQARRCGLALALALGLAALGAGCASPRQEFLGARVADRCDSQWPVCDQIAGCLIGDSSYIEGKFPGNGRLAVQLFEPSTVKMSFMLENISAAGDETIISFYEDQCRARVRLSITGRTFVGEAEKVGWVSREAELSGVGDHLIVFSSDARLSYLAKIEVRPARLQE